MEHLLHFNDNPEAQRAPSSRVASAGIYPTEGWEQFKPKVKNQSHNYHSMKVIYPIDPKSSKFEILETQKLID